MDVILQLLMLAMLVAAMSLAVYNTIKRRQRAAFAGGYDDAAPPSLPSRSDPPAQPQATERKLPPPFDPLWRTTVKDVVHLMIVGETGSGKSVAATALLVCRAVIDRVLIIDPHARPGDWGGMPAIGRGRDYAAIERAFIQLEAEMSRRFALAAEGKPYGPSVSIFVDEYPTIAANCKAAAPAFKALAREARKVGMRMVILTQDANVKTLGIEGEGPVRESFSRLLLGSFAVKALPAGLPPQAYPAALDYKGEVKPIPTMALPEYAAMPVSIVRMWGDLLEPAESGTGTTPPAAPKTAEKQPRIAPELVPEKPVLADTNAVPASSTSAPESGTSTMPTDKLSIAIRAMLGAGLSRNTVLDLLTIPGNRAAQLNRIKEALGELVVEPEAIAEGVAQ